MIVESFMMFLQKIMFFSSYIKNCSSFPKPLTPEEEKIYLEKFEKGDEKAKEILIEHNLRLVAHVVKKYNQADEADDLISVGSLGLIKAINSYKLNHGTQFSTYAAKCIENAIRSQMRLWSKTSILRAAKSPNGIFLFKFQRINAYSAPLWEDMLGMRPCISIVLG